MPSQANRMLRRLHVLCAATCRMFAVRRTGGMSAATCRTFIVRRCMLSWFYSDSVFICFGTLRRPLSTNRVSQGWKENDRGAAKRRHDESVHENNLRFYIDARDYQASGPDSPFGKA